MYNKITIVTVTRSDLFDIAHVLSAAVKAAFPRRKKDSMIIAVQGSYACGKSIFGDVLRQDIWGPRTKCDIRGKKNFDEFVFRKDNGRTIEYSYIDIAHYNDYALPHLNQKKYDEREANFLKQRQHPGISVIQNKRDTEDAAIEVWVEKPYGEIVYYDRWGHAEKDIVNATDQRRVTKSNYISAFKMAGQLNFEWARYVEIKLDPKLVKKCPELQDILASLAVQSDRAKRNLERLKTGDCDVAEFTRRLKDHKYGPGVQ